MQVLLFEDASGTKKLENPEETFSCSSWTMFTSISTNFSFVFVRGLPLKFSTFAISEFLSSSWAKMISLSKISVYLENQLLISANQFAISEFPAFAISEFPAFIILSFFFNIVNFQALIHLQFRWQPFISVFLLKALKIQLLTNMHALNQRLRNCLTSYWQI